MNANAVVRQYGALTPEERFRLILAAGARGDDAEQARLRRAGGRITLSTSDHSPWAHAFDELAVMAFIVLADEAARHQEAFELWSDEENLWGDAPTADEGPGDAGAGLGAAEATPGEPARAGAALPDRRDESSPPARAHDLYLAQGFILKTRLAGWELFCERLGIPPFAVWQILPGYDRLRRALDLLADNEFRPGPAFRPEGMVRWLCKIRPAGAAEPTPETLVSPESVADDLDRAFRARAAWWGG